MLCAVLIWRCALTVLSMRGVACRLVDSIKGRRKEKDCSPCIVAADLNYDAERGAGGDGDLRLDDDEFSAESIVDADLSTLVCRPPGVEHNEWLATHSQLTSTSL